MIYGPFATSPDYGSIVGAKNLNVKLSKHNIVYTLRVIYAPRAVNIYYNTRNICREILWF